MYEKIKTTVVDLSSGIPKVKIFTKDDVIIDSKPKQAVLEYAEENSKIILTVLHYPDSVMDVVKEENLSLDESRRLLRAWLKGYLESLDITGSHYMIVYMVTKDIVPTEWAIQQRERMIKDFNNPEKLNKFTFVGVTNVY